jgi:hypothetical protein
MGFQLDTSAPLARKRMIMIAYILPLAIIGIILFIVAASVAALLAGKSRK